MKKITFMTHTRTGKIEETREFPAEALDTEIDAEFLEWICMQNEAGWHDQKEEEEEGGDLNEILKECARLRGTFRLQHRTLKEFSWFVGAVLFREWDHSDRRDQEEYQALRKYADRPGSFKNSDNALIEWGRLFLEYSKEQAEETQKELEAEIDELSEDLKK